VTLTVIIVTLNRPDCVQKCIACLYAQAPLPQQIIVVDASPDDRTRRVVESFAEVPAPLYLRNENGYGRMTASRNIGLMHASGEIIAFLDDDAFAHEGWLPALLAAYDAPDVGAVGGRALNNQPNEATIGVNAIGKLTGHGTLEGNFAADPGRVIDADHIMGCNMSFRRELLIKLGGFREDYPGISGVREDSDMSLRVSRAGFRIRFTPFAVATHIGAPQAKGKRFDTRYAYYSARNHCVMLIRNYGLFSGIFVRYAMHAVIQAVREFVHRLGEGRFVSAGARLTADICGTFAGIFSGIAALVRTGRDPVRCDDDARQIRDALQKNAGSRSMSEKKPAEQLAQVPA